VAPRQPSRTQRCGGDEARSRLRDARAHLQVAELADSASAPEEIKAGISSAVLAGIAAADAACCQALGERARGQDHLEAASLVEQVAPDGPTAAKALERVLSLKDEAQYGFTDLGGQRLLASLRQARALTAFAESVLER